MRCSAGGRVGEARGVWEIFTQVGSLEMRLDAH